MQRPDKEPGKPSKKFPSTQRIRKKSSFKNVFDRGSFFRGKIMNGWILKDADGKKTRLGMIVSRKAFSRATERNRWKRRCREVFRQYQAFISAGTEVLVQAKKTEKVPGFEEIKKELARLLEKAKALREPFPESESACQ